MLREVLENTLNPLREVRQQAELFLQNSVTSDGLIDISSPLNSLTFLVEFIITLADFSSNSENPISLRQVSG
jgi:hypothetical protein